MRFFKDITNPLLLHYSAREWRGIFLHKVENTSFQGSTNLTHPDAPKFLPSFILSLGSSEF